MGYTFNVSEIFEIAGQMERNGFEFYQTAASDATDEKVKKLLLGLAEMEGDHEKTFSDLKESVVGSKESDALFDPTGEAALYLKAIANARVFFERKIDTSSLKEVLKEAIQAERDSIVFYLGMKNMIPDQEGKTKMETIIQEEMSHIRLLSEKLIAVENG